MLRNVIPDSWKTIDACNNKLYCRKVSTGSGAPLITDKIITLNENNYFDSYLWSTGETTPSIVINQPGNYSLTVTEIHGSVVCSTTKTVLPISLNCFNATINR